MGYLGQGLWKAEMADEKAEVDVDLKLLASCRARISVITIDHCLQHAA